ncbi:MAG: response regulator [Desulfobacterales bacterium]|nr:response regulator [Desulfobacterales bacterium]
MTKSSILIVEDDFKIAQVMREYLEKSGYSVTCLTRGDQVYSQVCKNKPDLILLDVMLPGKDGMEVCKDIRKQWDIPIIMITAKIEEVDRILGLELGADDYICKPFSPREVVARIKAVFRRSQKNPENMELKVGLLELNPASFEVTADGHVMSLTPNEFALLKVFMSRPNRVFSRNELVSLVQGYEFEGYERTIDTHIKNIRKKLSKVFLDQEIIITVYGIGYRMKLPE